MTIQVLPARLANQIAAGEVVERPASVIKELVENALDAGATLIDIEVQKGGSKLIRIRDNGSGIAKDELALALSRHATSKVSNFDDLENITSLGFRGEALASISSVSRLQLTSKPAAQSEAWQAYAEGRDMEVKIIPAAHPDGTTIEVSDLFFNTPARRKFMRSEKTEFYHIDEVIKRIALSRFDVQFSLTHNGKSVRHLRRAMSDQEKDRRIGQICAKGVIDNMVRLSCDYDGVNLSGWVALPQGCRNQNDVQYSYVNGRMMRDKLINHAIRQAYGSMLHDQQYPTYVLYLTLDPRQIDVNVHPAKHEVRFHQARLVHDFIVQALEQAVTAQSSLIPEVEQSAAPVPAPQMNNQYAQQTAQLPQQTGDTGNLLQGLEPIEQSSALQNHSSQSQAAQNQAAQNQAAQSHAAQNSIAQNPYPNTPVSEPMQVAESAPVYQVEQNNQKAFMPATGYQSNKPSPKELKSYHQALTSFSAPLTAQPTSPLAAEPSTLSNPQPANAVMPASATDIRCLAVIEAHCVLAQSDTGLYLVDLNKVNGAVACYQYGEGLIGQPLLLPLKIAQDKSTLQLLTNFNGLLARLGVEFQCLDRHVVIRKVPAIIRHSDINQVTGALIEQLRLISQQNDADETLIWQHCICWLVENYGGDTVFDLSAATQLLHRSLQWIDGQTLFARCAVVIELSDYISQLANRRSDETVIKAQVVGA